MRNAANLDRHRAESVRPGAELAVIVVAPSPKASIRLYCQAMEFSAGSAHKAGAPGNWDRYITVGNGPVAELAFIIHAPAPGRAIGLDCKTVRPTGCHSHNTCKAADLHWHRAAVIIAI